MTQAVAAAFPPGIHTGVSFDDYAAIDAVNASLLNEFRRTPAHVLHYMQSGGKERTPALELGKLVHLLIFEPENFDDEFYVAPKVDRRFKSGKDAWAIAEEEASGRSIITPEQKGSALGIIEALRAHETADEFFSGRGENEITIVWEDDEHGVVCKARIDRISLIGEWPIVGDLKTSRDASHASFGRSVLNFGYDVQAVHYLSGLQKLQPVPAGNPFRRFVFFVIESDAPHCVAAYELDDETLEEGARKRSRYLRQWRECVTSGKWPGYPPGINYASLPAWAFKSYIDD